MVGWAGRSIGLQYVTGRAGCFVIPIYTCSPSSPPTYLPKSSQRYWGHPANAGQVLYLFLSDRLETAGYTIDLLLGVGVGDTWEAAGGGGGGVR
jgi:hypothetical protein